MKNRLLVIVIFVLGLRVWAQNPIVPPGMYIADPEAHVWNDDKLYIYGSRDESADYWCSYDYHVLSTSDMIHWNIDENSFSSKGTKGDFSRVKVLNICNIAGIDPR